MDVLSSSTDPTRITRWRVTTIGKTITQAYRNDEHAEADARLMAASKHALRLAQSIVHLESSPLARDYVPPEIQQLAREFLKRATGSAT
jgi:hypothetical protein